VLNNLANITFRLYYDLVKWHYLLMECSVNTFMEPELVIKGEEKPVHLLRVFM